MPRTSGRRRIFAEKGKGKGTWLIEDESMTRSYLGDGNEGHVHGANFSVESKSGGRRRTVGLAEKEFFEKKPSDITRRDPERQFATARELLELSRKKKLGLRLPPTVRLLRREGRPTLLLTWFRGEHGSGLKEKWILNPEEKKQFDEDFERQMRTLESEGYIANEWRDKFEPYFDPKEKRYVALLLDFGGVRKK